MIKTDLQNGQELWRNC